MVGTTVLHHPHFFIMPEEDFQKTPDLDFGVKAQESISLIKRCSTLKDFKQVHGQVLKLGMFWNPFCASNLLTTCALSEWGSMDYACSIFLDIEDPGAFEFNTMIRGHIKEMNQEEALLMYTEMLERGVEPDNFTYPALLKACARLTALAEGTQLHGHILKLGLQTDVFVQNSLISMYGKCGEIRDSILVFDQMDQKTIATWSALISAHTNLEMWSECLELFAHMNHEGFWRAEESLLVSVLSACTHLDVLDLGKCIHGYVLRNMSGLNVIVETALIDMYAKCGFLEKGLRLFERMAEKNQISYSTIISGLALHGYGQEALNNFSQMLHEGLEPDDVTYVGVLSACSHAGLVNEGLEFYDKMILEHGIRPTIQHYGCMVDLLGKAGMLKEALELTESMSMEPNDVLWRSLLHACKVHRKIELGEIAAEKLFQLNCHNASDYLTLANMYAQAQRWEEVAEIRTRIAREGITQEPGSSSVLVNRKLYKFLSQDMSNPQCDGVYEMLYQMEWQLKFEGYSPDTSQVLMNVDEEEKRHRLRTHSQKLAIAFALIHTSKHSCIRIVRNVGMCSDCHTYTKLISMIYEREIIVRDRNRFHHFKHGTCSCRDYW